MVAELIASGAGAHRRRQSVIAAVEGCIEAERWSIPDVDDDDSAAARGTEGIY
eukprot:CAMPEP_0172318420 /NCGR_PEP_ID=MMETSP1058-20130122/34810_1 /TAXON_ID=83371 /ORGANISM="Detonula confervacea, Strain CCMP 353" /LENGTH=52 /DNA_ID=CAMNT_0013033251 /DNA_START=555 /DNA_END=713 /DNA_ORIENTATION=-